MQINGYTIEPSAYLSGADLSYADLRNANLTGANLSGANLSGANLSGAIGIPTAKSFLRQFRCDSSGFYAFKCFGKLYSPPEKWKIEPGAIITEVCNMDRGTPCGSGINLATLDWVMKSFPESTIWECLVDWRDAADVVVPFGTDGKFRASRVKLIRIVRDGVK